MRKAVFGIAAAIAIGIVIAFSIPYQVYAQSLSELDRQLDEENLQKAQEIGIAQQQEIAIEQQEEQPSFQSVDCPPGQIEKAVSGGGIICVYDESQAILVDENTSYIAIGVIIVIIIIAILVKAKQGARGSGFSTGKRKSFSNSVKEQVLKRQGHRCNDCHRLLNVVDYDHIDGDHSNNGINNSQALCPNCHAEKSRRAQSGLD